MEVKGAREKREGGKKPSTQVLRSGCKLQSQSLSHDIVTLGAAFA